MTPHVIRNEKIQPTTIRRAHLSWIPKRLFDALDNDLLQDDRKSALEVPIIEEFMRRAMCRPRWCPHNRNAADAMTKFKGAHSEPLFTLLRTGMHTLKGEKSGLPDRAKSTTNWNCTTTQSERCQIRDGTNLFCSYAIGLRGSLSGVPEGGAM